ncbi:MAG: vitamin B12 dependent-methionine synthase activation domain-containing protein [Bacteroidaceae bacterium]
MIITRKYSISDLVRYIDWSYFLHAWQLSPRFAVAANLHDCKACRETWVMGLDETERESGREVLKLIGDARKMLGELSTRVMIEARVGVFNANSVDDDIIVTTDENEEVCIPCLRQQVEKRGEPYLCLADFVRPRETRRSDMIGVFVSTVRFDPTAEYGGDPYNLLLSQTLCDRLAEAGGCVLHKETRCRFWPDDKEKDLTIEDLQKERNKGIRPAVGYPSLPDQSVNFILNDLIKMSDLGVTLSETGAMIPHATVSGLMIGYEESRYFGVGPIDETQLKDYAARRGLGVAEMRRYLSANLREV